MAAREGLINMLPAFAIYNARDIAVGNSIVFSDSLHPLPVCAPLANHAHVIGGQFGHVRFFALRRIVGLVLKLAFSVSAAQPFRLSLFGRHQSKPASVLHITRACGVLEVFYPVICFNSVAVVDDVIPWALTKKGGGNESVNTFAVRDIILPQIDSYVAITFGEWFQNAIAHAKGRACVSSDSPKIRRAVDPLPTRYLAKLFAFDWEAYAHAARVTKILATAFNAVGLQTIRACLVTKESRVRKNQQAARALFLANNGGIFDGNHDVSLLDRVTLWLGSALGRNPFVGPFLLYHSPQLVNGKDKEKEEEMVN